MTQVNGVMMQYFHWYIDPDLILWNEVRNKAAELAQELKQHNITVSIGTIKNIWKEENLSTKELRIKKSQSLNIEV